MTARQALVPAVLCGLAAAVASVLGQAPAPARAPAAPGSSVAATPRDTTGRITGTVLVAGTGRPARSARVSVAGGEPRTTRTEDTDEEGRFEFVTLRPGEYAVSVEKPGFVPVSYGEMPAGSRRGAREIEVASGGHVDLRLEMPVGGVVSGRVIDERGEPAVRTSVRAMRVETQGGRRTLRPSGSAGTDDRGIYRLFGLQPGDYYVAAIPEPEPVRMRPSASATARPANAASKAQAGYAPVYSPGVTTMRNATLVRLGPAQERGSLDIVLERVPLARIEGFVIGPPQGAVVHLTLVNREDHGLGILPTSVQAGPDGFFRLLNVPAGRYAIVASSTSANRRLVNQIGDDAEPIQLWGTTEVTVDGEDVHDVAVALRRGVAISGHITYTSSGGGRVPIGSARTTVRVVPVPGGDAVSSQIGRQTSGRVEAGRDFRITDVPPGRYRLVAMSDGGWAMQSAFAEGRDTLDFPIDVTPERGVDDVVITFSDQKTGLSGVVRSANGRPTSDATLFVYASDRQYWTQPSRRIFVVRPATNGHFKIPDLPPGTYDIAIGRDPDPSVSVDAAFLDKLEPILRSVTLVEGEQKVQDLRVPAAPR